MSRRDQVAGLLLAAGEGRRFGRPKALVEFDGERLVDRGVRTLREAGCGPIVVVMGAAAIEVIGAVATYGGRPRNPVLIAAEHFAAVSESATGDAGARAFLRAHPELVTSVPCDGIAAPDDIDTPEDLTAIRARPTPPPTPPSA